MRRTALFSVAATLVCVSFLLVPSAEGTKVLVEKPAVQPAAGQPVAYQPVDTEALAGLGATILAEYPFFYLADVPAASLAQFLLTAQTRGFAVTAREGFDQIRINGYGFASVGALPSLPPPLALADYPGPIGLYLVQMVGPNRAEWERALQAIGTPILYYADNTYLVRASPKRVADLRALPFLQHVSVYQPAYKLRADVLAAESPVSVVVQLDGGQDLTNAFAILSGLAARELDNQPSGPVANVAIEITPNDAITLAFLPEVLWIERLLPAAPSDERQALPLAGYSNGTQPTNPTLYDNWLIAKGFCTPLVRPPGCLDYGNVSNPRNSVVVVYDSGLDINVCNGEGTDCSGGTKTRHPDLDPREARFFCADSGSTNYCQQGSQFVYSDDCGHGTAVASVITGDPISGVEALQLPGVSARDGGNYYLGSGIAPLARIATRKIFHLIPPYLCGSYTSLSAGDFQRWGAGMVASFGNQGARFANHSWNFTTDDTYNTVSQMFDRLVRDADGNADHYDRPSTIVLSAGNRQYTSWTSSVTAPANAKNVITVGASESWRTSDVAPWTSSGYPNPDDPSDCRRGDATSIKNISKWSRRGSAPETGYGTRFKPDLVAGGTRVGAAYSRALVSQDVACDPNASGDPNGRYYIREFGTSFAAPVVTGAVVLADAWYRNKTNLIPSPAMLRAVLVGHGDDLYGGEDMMYPGPDGHGASLTHRPSQPQGWGRVNLEKLFATNGIGVQFFDEDHGQTPVRRFLPGSASWSTTLTFTPPNPDIVVVVVYTDSPAAPGGAGPLGVNNLDLVAWDGIYKYYGNTFDATGYTPRTLLGLAGDVANTVEMVKIRAGELAGTSFAAEVRPAAISAKAVPGLDGSSSNQDFALYVYFAR